MESNLVLTVSLWLVAFGLILLAVFLIYKAVEPEKSLKKLLKRGIILAEFIWNEKDLSTKAANLNLIYNYARLGLQNISVAESDALYIVNSVTTEIPEYLEKGKRYQIVFVPPHKIKVGGVEVRDMSAFLKQVQLYITESLVSRGTISYRYNPTEEALYLREIPETEIIDS